MKSTSTTLIVAKIPKMPMDFQNAAASSSCIAVSNPFPWKERMTSSRTRGDCQQQQQRDGQDRPPAEPSSDAAG